MKIEIPQEVLTLMKKIKAKGYEIYVVGGCVRDRLLGSSPKDWDLCTDAQPEEIMEVFEDFSVIPTGIRHGTVTVIGHHQHYEITTYRKERKYTDGRHPMQVDFVRDLREDLLRRDFTVNAMAYNETEGLKDYFGGQDDLQKRVIRTVGEAEKRFSEDYLRMLRAVRFATVLDFEIESDTMEAIVKYAPRIMDISKERIREELCKIMESQNAVSGIRTLEASGLLSQILPELQACKGCLQKHPSHDNDVYGHILEVLGYLSEAPSKVKWAALLHDIGKADVKLMDEDGIAHCYGHEEERLQKSRAILQRLKFSNRAIEEITLLVKNHGYLPKLEKKAVKRFLQKIGEHNVKELMILQRADQQTHVGRCKDENYWTDLQTIIDQIVADREAITMSDLKLTGKDLIAMGCPQGARIGELKAKLLQHVLEHPQDNKKEKLIELAREWMKDEIGQRMICSSDREAHLIS